MTGPALVSARWSRRFAKRGPVNCLDGRWLIRRHSDGGAYPWRIADLSDTPAQTDPLFDHLRFCSLAQAREHLEGVVR